MTSATGYAYWASYLVNGDGSGLEPEEADEAEAFASYVAGAGRWQCGDFTCEGESFYSRPDYPREALLGDCVTYTFHERTRH